ncbi:MAG: alkaline phosphatase family protein [Acidobacteriota bacterium]
MRNLTNSLLGGLFAALLFAQAFFLLNPQISLDLTTLVSVGGVLAVTYGVAAGVGFWLLTFLIEKLRDRPLRPAWLSLRLLAWLFMIDLAMAAALLWHNLFYYRLYLPPEGIRAIAVAATILSAAAAVLLLLGLFHYSFGRRGPRLAYSLVVLAPFISLFAPLASRPEPSSLEPAVPRLPLEGNPSPRRLSIIGMEGLSMAYVLPAVAEGKLPNFARLIEGGASGVLKTLYPTESLAVWTSVATGKLPRQHGLTGFYRYRFPRVRQLFSLLPHGAYFRGLEKVGLLKRAAVDSTLRRTQTFWSILSRFGVRVGLVRWWGSYPAEEVDGFIVSEFLHRQVREHFNPPLPELTYPPHLSKRLAPLVSSPKDIAASLVERFVDTAVEVPGDSLSWEPVLRRALADDTTYLSIGRELRETYQPQVYGIYCFGLDVVGHHFFRFHRPASFGDVRDSEVRKYGRVVEAYYDFLDTMLGEHLRSRRPDEVLVVLSGHGMEPLPLARRILETFKGDPQLSGYHDDAPDGLAIFYGPGIARGAKLQGASVLDITPTLLHLMGLPLGRDMDGTLLTDVLEESFLRSQPVTFISSYHNFLIEPRKEADPYELPSPLDSLPGILDGRE